MLFIYPAIFHKEDNSYWVEFPDLEGCQTFGDTLTDTVAGAQEALAGYILTVLEGGGKLAKPKDITSYPVAENAFASLVSCDVNPYKNKRAVKKTLTIPAWLNDLAEKENINFSFVLQSALKERLNV